MVDDFAHANAKLDKELGRVKDKAMVKLHRRDKKLEKLNRHCSNLATDLHSATHALRDAESNAHAGSRLFVHALHSLQLLTVCDFLDVDAVAAAARVRALAAELKNAREKQAHYKSDLEKAKHIAHEKTIKERCLKDKNLHMYSHLKESHKINHQYKIEKQVVSDELAALREAHEVAMALNEELKVDVYNLKTALKADHALRGRQEVIATANDHYRNMNPYLGVIFVNEPWPVSSTHSAGVLLSQVRKNCAGHVSGLRTGDVVTEVQGRPTRSKAEFYAAMFGVKPGDTMHFHIIRPSQGPGIVRSINVTMGANGYELKSVLALRRLAERNAENYTDSFDRDCEIAGLENPSSGCC